MEGKRGVWIDGGVGGWGKGVVCREVESMEGLMARGGGSARSASEREFRELGLEV